MVAMAICDRRLRYELKGSIIEGMCCPLSIVRAWKIEIGTGRRTDAHPSACQHAWRRVRFMTDVLRHSPKMECYLRMYVGRQNTDFNSQVELTASRFYSLQESLQARRINIKYLPMYTLNPSIRCHLQSDNLKS
ncbi:hypothetical protein NEUTE2DRAFT_84793, partial [Neurospora tetrasperma FGSC 2509]